MLPLLFAATTALIASLGLTPAARKLAVHMGAVDLPGPRKVHATPVPLWGGLAMYTAAALAVFLFAERVDPIARTQIIAIFAGATLLVVVGTLDDGGFLHHQVKLMVAMPIAAGILVWTGIRADVFAGMFGSTPLWTTVDLIITVGWVVGITAAFSILDHMDGLCAGVAAVAAAFFLMIALAGGQILVATLAAAVLGAAVGFLRWNFNPARIFMGDGGAMFLGFMMATLGLKLRVDHLPIGAALVPVFVLAVPIFDTTLVTISRTRRGLLPFASPGKDHTSHRLVGLGLGQRHAVLALYAVGLAGGLVAAAFTRVATSLAFVLGGACAFAMLAMIVWFEQCAFERQEPHAAVSCDSVAR